LEEHVDPKKKEELEARLENKVNAAVTKAVAEARADWEAKALKDRPPPAAIAAAKNLTDLRRDATALLGYRVMKAWAATARNVPAETLGAITKAAGALEAVFAQGGSLVPQAWDSETIEVLRDITVLLRAGVRVKTYKGILNCGRLNGGAVAAMVAEGGSPAATTLSTDAVVLGAKKAMALLNVSNDLLRNPSWSNAYDVGVDMAQALGVLVDGQGLNGDGVGPNIKGIPLHVKAAHKFAIAGTTLADKIADFDKMTRVVMESKIPFEGNAPGWVMSSKTFMGLKSLRDNAGWVFRHTLDLPQPMLNGYPVWRTDSIASANIVEFGLFRQLFMGIETELEIASFEPDFKADETTFRGVMRVDTALRHDSAFAVLTGVTY
jgi:HK97 family phage major capsid protein